MLYATTRNARETYTAQRAMTEKRAPDGGYYVPFREPYFYASDLRTFSQKDFLEVTAEVLNLLLGTRLTPLEIEFTVGRHPIGLQKIGRRTVAGERWRNVSWTFSGLVAELTREISLQAPENRSAGPWAHIAAGTAVLFGIWSQLLRARILNSGDLLDVAVGEPDLLSAASAVYAKSWGLPLGRVVCGCQDSDGLWDLLHSGEVPAQKAPEDLELLLSACGGPEEVRRFLYCREAKKHYRPSDPVFRKLKDSVAAAVIGEKRIYNTLPAVFATHHYLLSLDGALAYAGLLDYRATSGSGSWGLVLCDRSPSLDIEVIAAALHRSENDVRKLLMKP